MKESKSLAVLGLAATAAAMGFEAAGAFAIGRLSIRRMSIKNAVLGSLEIQELKLERLRVAEVTVSRSIALPEGKRNYDGCRNQNRCIVTRTASTLWENRSPRSVSSPFKSLVVFQT